MAASVTRMIGHFIPAGSAEPIDDHLDAWIANLNDSFALVADGHFALD
jgi:hypothetical protein